MQTGTKAVNATAQKNRNLQRKPEKQQNVSKQCKYCTGSNKKGKCPAYGKKCRSCGKLDILVKVLERARSQGIKVKKEKIQYKVKETKYIRSIISADGMK